MAFITLTTTEIGTGKPTTNSALTKVKDNFDNHESRLIAVESGGAVTYPPIIMRVNGYYAGKNLTDGLLKTTLNFNLTITGVRLIIDVAGSSGTTEIDLEYKRGVGSWTSIFTTKPSVVYSAGNDASSSNAVLDTSKVALEAGDFLRLDLKSVQTAGNSFMVRIDYVKN